MHVHTGQRNLDKALKELRGELGEVRRSQYVYMLLDKVELLDLSEKTGLDP